MPIQCFRTVELNANHDQGVVFIRPGLLLLAALLGVLWHSCRTRLLIFIADSKPITGRV